MTEVDTMRALARIERALARIEAVEQGVAARAVPAAPAPALAERHDRLRTRVRETLDRLDSLIAEADA